MDAPVQACKLNTLILQYCRAIGTAALAWARRLPAKKIRDAHRVAAAIRADIVTIGGEELLESHLIKYKGYYLNLDGTPRFKVISHIHGAVPSIVMIEVEDRPIREFLNTRLAHNVEIEQPITA